MRTLPIASPRRSWFGRFAVAFAALALAGGGGLATAQTKTETLRTRRPRSGAAVDARDLSKRYGARDVLNNVGLAITHCGFVAIFGRSGSGKSPLLRMRPASRPPAQGRPGARVSLTRTEMQGPIERIWQRHGLTLCLCAFCAYQLAI